MYQSLSLTETPSYLDLSNLSLQSTLADLPTHQFQISPATVGEVVAQEFERRPHLPGAIIMEGTELIGGFSRRKFTEQVGRPYGVEVYLKRAVKILYEHLDIGLLQLPSECTIEVAAQSALSRSPDSVYEPVIVEFPVTQQDTRRSDTFVVGGKTHKEYRLLNIYILLLAQSKLLGIANDTIQSRAKELERINADKDKLFSIISHDLKAPFSPLLGLCELLPLMIEQAKYSQAVEASEAMLRSAKNVYSLLENLLEWATVQRDSSAPEPNEVDLQEIVSRNIRLLNENASEKEIELVNDVPDPMMVYANERLLDTVMRNLINNALKFTDAGGKITVVSQTDTDTAMVSVSDTGVGIPPERIPGLFEVGKNRSTLGTAKEKGTGLGLVLCKEMVEKNRGKIWVESEVGVGTTFKFTIPLPTEENIARYGVKHSTSNDE